jgi:hypothetical protein
MRISSFSVLALGVFGLAGIQLSACSNSSEDCNATATCGNTAGTSQSGTAGKSSGGGSGADAGSSNGGTPATGGSLNTSGTNGTSGSSMSGAGGEGGSGPKPCTGDVSDDAACWTSNDYGVFVSSESGDDAAGDGTKELPFATIAKGIAAAAAASKNIYICLGAIKDTYAEKVSLDASVDGLKIYGGFDCADWSYSTTRKSSVVSPEVIALRIASLKKGVYIENVRFTAADGNGTDASSYGAFVTDSKGVALKRVELTAGAGLKGKDGDPGTKGENGSAAGTPPVGSDACAASPIGGKWAGENVCGSLGGPGGTGAKNTSNGPPGGAGSPTEHVSPIQDINNGGLGEADGVADWNGKAGTPGDSGDVASMAAAQGSLTATGYIPADGGPGNAGYTGQGGGGGGASKGKAACAGASGGGGGMGGCGGKPGQGGGGGGASVAAFVWNADVGMAECTLKSATGGAGGAGGKGGGGGSGANGGSGGAEDGANAVKPGGNGGRGGTGGNGGSGSGGTGGPSYALVYFGTQPTYDLADTTLKAGKGGAAGVGGKVLDAKAPDGSVGDAAAEFMVP